MYICIIILICCVILSNELEINVLLNDLLI